jgi:hypothetical protein
LQFAMTANILTHRALPSAVVTGQFLSCTLHDTTINESEDLSAANPLSGDDASRCPVAAFVVARGTCFACSLMGDRETHPPDARVILQPGLHMPHPNSNHSRRFHLRHL